MDKKTTDVTNFLIQWNDLLTQSPVSGSIPKIYFLFISSTTSKGKDRVSWLQFVKILRKIDDMTKNDILSKQGCFQCTPSNSLRKQYNNPFNCFARITYINRISLILLWKMKSCTVLDDSSNFIPKTLNEEDTCVKENKEKFENEIKEKLDEKGKDEEKAKEKEKNKNITSNIKKPSKENLLKNLNEIFDHQSNTLNSMDNLYSVNITNYEANERDEFMKITTRENRLRQLNTLLETPCSSYLLSKEKARLRTPITAFIPSCNDPKHIQTLTTFCVTNKQTNYSKLNFPKLQEYLRTNGNNNNNNNNHNHNNHHGHSNKHNANNFTDLEKRELFDCINNKIHFIPIMQQQTDLKLGDCSYLDTCHKMSSCRYIHYGQLMPLSNNIGANRREVIEHNENINEILRVSDFTRGEITSCFDKKELPAQWINCDIRKLDFKILGKFSVIIADPAWSIHMSLPYGTCEDNDLLELKMNELQDEGLFLLWVTGRSIEIGRKFLNGWGYEVINQITWIKTNQLVRTITTGRTGHWLNHSKEHLLIGIKGNPKWLNKNMDPQLLISSTRETSRKPDEIYGIVDRLVGPRSRKLEIFGRTNNTRPGWITIGNQLNSTRIIEKEISSKLAASGI